MEQHDAPRLAAVTRSRRSARCEPSGGDGGLQVWGSTSLARQLVENDLVDEYQLMLEPILLGGGKTIFPSDGQARPLELGVGDPGQARACSSAPTARPAEPPQNPNLTRAGGQTLVPMAVTPLIRDFLVELEDLLDRTERCRDSTAIGSRSRPPTRSPLVVLPHTDGSAT